MATSNEMIRPVILSRPAKTAVGCLILSATASVAAQAAIEHPKTTALSQLRAFIAKIGPAASMSPRVVAGFPVAGKAGRNDGALSRPASRPDSRRPRPVGGLDARSSPSGAARPAFPWDCRDAAIPIRAGDSPRLWAAYRPSDEASH